MFGITGISGLSNPLGSEGLASSKQEDEDSGEGAPVKKAGGTNGTHTEGGIVKANKGMILRKSVEYIKYASLHSHTDSFVGRLTSTISTLRYLQQLVSAQALQDHSETTGHGADGFNDPTLHEDVADPDFVTRPDAFSLGPPLHTRASFLILLFTLVFHLGSILMSHC